jgi:hypothetical protein
MILSIFKKNNLATFLVMVFIGLLLWADGLIFHEWQSVDQVNLSPFYVGLMGLLPNNSIFVSILAFVLLVMQALMINYIVEKHKVIRKKKMLPGLIYIVLMSMHTSMLGLHPALLANFFLIMAISYSLGELSGKRAVIGIFNIGLFVSLAGFLFFPAYILFFAILMQRGLFSVAKLKGIFAYLLGFGTPFFFAANYYFHTSILDERFSEFFQEFQNIRIVGFSAELVPTILFVYTGLIFLITTVYLSFSYTSGTTTTMRSRMVNIGIFFVFATVAFSFSGIQWVLASCLLFVPSSIAMAVWLIEQRKKWFAEVVVIILLFLIVLSKAV